MRSPLFDFFLKKNKPNTRCYSIILLWIASILPIAGSFVTTSRSSAGRSAKIKILQTHQSSPSSSSSCSSSSALHSSVEQETTLSNDVNDINNDNDDVLSAIFGSRQRRIDFINNDLGRNIVRLHRDELSLASPLEHLFQMKDLYDDLSEFTVLRKRGSSQFLNKTVMPTFSDLESYIATGGSAVVSMPPKLLLEQNEQPTETFQKFLKFKESVESSLERPTSINVYHSGPRAVALNRHYDSYDVIVIQLEGEKEWEIKLPSSYVEGLEEDLWTNTTLKPGDVLYLPQGIWHAATTVEGFSSTTHATIGLLDPPESSD